MSVIDALTASTWWRKRLIPEFQLYVWATALTLPTTMLTTKIRWSASFVETAATSAQQNKAVWPIPTSIMDKSLLILTLSAVFSANPLHLPFSRLQHLVLTPDATFARHTTTCWATRLTKYAIVATCTLTITLYQSKVFWIALYVIHSELIIATLVTQIDLQIALSVKKDTGFRPQTSLSMDKYESKLYACLALYLLAAKGAIARTCV